MQITLETDYAVRCLVYLKDHAGETRVLGDISKGTLIPRAFLSKILQKLIRAGLVSSTKGKNGGFTLAVPARGVSVYRIMQAVCGRESVLKTVCRKPGRPCSLSRSCRISAVWRDLCGLVRKKLESHRLSDL